jgi:hypothetical protein
MVSGRFTLSVKMTDVIYHSPVLQSSKISKSCVMLIKPRWVISTLISGTSANNTGVTSSLLFLPNFLRAQIPAVTFYHGFILITTAARDSLTMTL